MASAAAPTARHAAPSGTEIILASTAFGRSLAVGSGPFKNYTLYFLSSGHGSSYGCTTGATPTPFGPITCTGPSARAWPPAYTNGSPGYSGVPASGVGVTGLPSGLSQITWNGHPLHLFSNEALAPTPNGGATPVGNGNGIKAFGGTFSLVFNP